MQEEIEQKVVVEIKGCARLTGAELRRALAQLLIQLKNQKARSAQQGKGPHGKMTVRQLAAQDRGMQSIEVTDKNIGSFNRVAWKYGIDFAPFKVKGEDKYLVFFKAPDTDAMTAAFTEYTQKQVRQASRPSMLAKLQKLQEQMKNVVHDRTKRKERER